MAHLQHRRYTGPLGFLVFGAAAFACGSSEHSGDTPVGGACTTSQDCAGQSCVGGVCQSSNDGGSGGSTAGDGGSIPDDGSTAGGASGSPAGSSCSQASDCQSGKCTGGL